MGRGDEEKKLTPNVDEGMLLNRASEASPKMMKDADNYLNLALTKVLHQCNRKSQLTVFRELTLLRSQQIPQYLTQSNNSINYYQDCCLHETTQYDKALPLTLNKNIFLVLRLRLVLVNYQPCSSKPVSPEFPSHAYYPHNFFLPKFHLLYFLTIHANSINHNHTATVTMTKVHRSLTPPTLI